MDGLGLNSSNPSVHYKASYAHPYASSVSSASSSSSSVFSLDGVSAAQSAISSASTNLVDVIWENEGESLPSRPPLVSHGSQGSLRGNIAAKPADTAVAPELRKHPRRTNNYFVQSNGVTCTRPPPCLMRQSERKVNFVDNLVGELDIFFGKSS